MNINKKLGLPLYQQIENDMREKIISKDWEAGFKLDSEKNISDSLQVSTITVKKAITNLVEEGFLERKIGKGTFVINQNDKDVSRILSFEDNMKKNIDKLHKTIEFLTTPAGEYIGEHMNISPESKVYKIKRIRLEKGFPMAIEYSYLPVKLFPNLKESDIKNNLIYTILINNYGEFLQKAKIYFSTSKANEDERKTLDIDSYVPLSVLERKTVNAKESIVEFSIYKINQGDEKIHLEIDL